MEEAKAGDNGGGETKGGNDGGTDDSELYTENERLKRDLEEAKAMVDTGNFSSEAKGGNDNELHAENERLKRELEEAKAGGDNGSSEIDRLKMELVQAKRVRRVRKPQKLREEVSNSNNNNSSSSSNLLAISDDTQRFEHLSEQNAMIIELLKQTSSSVLNVEAKIKEETEKKKKGGFFS